MKPQEMLTEIYQDDKIMEFLLEKCKTVTAPIGIHALIDEFIQINGHYHSASTICKRFRKKTAAKMHITDEFSLSKKAKLLFLTSLPVNPLLMEEFEKHALVDLDEDRRITKYYSFNEKLKLKGTHLKKTTTPMRTPVPSPVPSRASPPPVAQSKTRQSEESSDEDVAPRTKKKKKIREEEESDEEYVEPRHKKKKKTREEEESDEEYVQPRYKKNNTREEEESDEEYVEPRLKKKVKKTHEEEDSDEEYMEPRHKKKVKKTHEEEDSDEEYMEPRHKKKVKKTHEEEDSDEEYVEPRHKKKKTRGSSPCSSATPKSNKKSKERNDRKGSQMKTRTRSQKRTLVSSSEDSDYEPTRGKASKTAQRAKERVRMEVDKPELAQKASESSKARGKGSDNVETSKAHQKESVMNQAKNPAQNKSPKNTDAGKARETRGKDVHSVVLKKSSEHAPIEPKSTETREKDKTDKKSSEKSGKEDPQAVNKNNSKPPPTVPVSAESRIKHPTAVESTRGEASIKVHTLKTHGKELEAPEKPGVAPNHSRATNASDAAEARGKKSDAQVKSAQNPTIGKADEARGAASVKEEPLEPRGKGDPSSVNKKSSEPPPNVTKSADPCIKVEPPVNVEPTRGTTSSSSSNQSGRASVALKEPLTAPEPPTVAKTSDAAVTRGKQSEAQVKPVQSSAIAKAGEAREAASVKEEPLDPRRQEDPSSVIKKNSELPPKVTKSAEPYIKVEPPVTVESTRGTTSSKSGGNAPVALKEPLTAPETPKAAKTSDAAVARGKQSDAIVKPVQSSTASIKLEPHEKQDPPTVKNSEPTRVVPRINVEPPAAVESTASNNVDSSKTHGKTPDTTKVPETAPKTPNAAVAHASIKTEPRGKEGPAAVNKKNLESAQKGPAPSKSRIKVEPPVEPTLGASSKPSGKTTTTLKETGAAPGPPREKTLEARIKVEPPVEPTRGSSSINVDTSKARGKVADASKEPGTAPEKPMASKAQGAAVASIKIEPREQEDPPSANKKSSEPAQKEPKLTVAHGRSEKTPINVGSSKTVDRANERLTVKMEVVEPERTLKARGKEQATVAQNISHDTSQSQDPVTAPEPPTVAKSSGAAATRGKQSDTQVKPVQRSAIAKGGEARGMASVKEEPLEPRRKEDPPSTSKKSLEPSRNAPHVKVEHSVTEEPTCKSTASSKSSGKTPAALKDPGTAPESPGVAKASVAAVAREKQSDAQSPAIVKASKPHGTSSIKVETRGEEDSSSVNKKATISVQNDPEPTNMPDCSEIVRSLMKVEAPENSRNICVKTEEQSGQEYEEPRVTPPVASQVLEKPSKPTLPHDKSLKQVKSEKPAEAVLAAVTGGTRGKKDMRSEGLESEKPRGIVPPKPMEPTVTPETPAASEAPRASRAPEQSPSAELSEPPRKKIPEKADVLRTRGKGQEAKETRGNASVPEAPRAPEQPAVSSAPKAPEASSTPHGSDTSTAQGKKRARGNETDEEESQPEEPYRPPMTRRRLKSIKRRESLALPAPAPPAPPVAAPVMVPAPDPLAENNPYDMGAPFAPDPFAMIADPMQFLMDPHNSLHNIPGVDPMDLVNLINAVTGMVGESQRMTMAMLREQQRAPAPQIEEFVSQFGQPAPLPPRESGTPATIKHFLEHIRSYLQTLAPPQFVGYIRHIDAIIEKLADENEPIRPRSIEMVVTFIIGLLDPPVLQ